MHVRLSKSDLHDIVKRNMDVCLLNERRKVWSKTRWSGALQNFRKRVKEKSWKALTAFDALGAIAHGGLETGEGVLGKGG